MSFRVKIIEVNGDLCVPIPAAIIREFGWKVGDKVAIDYNKENSSILIKKVNS